MKCFGNWEWKVFKNLWKIYLQSLSPKSLTLTKEVLNKRIQINTTVEGLIPQLNLGLSKLDGVRQQLEKIKIEKKKIDGSKNFALNLMFQK